MPVGLKKEEQCQTGWSNRGYHDPNTVEPPTSNKDCIGYKIRPANDVLIQQDPYHPPLSFELPVFDPAINSEICPSGYYHDFKSANLMLIRDLLDQVSWDELFKNKPLDHMINILYEILYIAIDLLGALVPRLAKRDHQNYIECSSLSPLTSKPSGASRMEEERRSASHLNDHTTEKSVHQEEK
ncbi:hypothetical protein JTB14_002994 [Gonioctena quinquepunctata]|nr:hypothetical protein JTB14_002994 [Gonioctena quinquepunctata]